MQHINFSLYFSRYYWQLLVSGKSMFSNVPILIFSSFGSILIAVQQSTANIESEKNTIESVAFEFESTQTDKSYRNGKLGNQ